MADTLYETSQTRHAVDRSSRPTAAKSRRVTSPSRQRLRKRLLRARVSSIAPHETSPKVDSYIKHRPRSRPTACARGGAITGWSSVCFCLGFFFFFFFFAVFFFGSSWLVNRSYADSMILWPNATRRVEGPLNGRSAVNAGVTAPPPVAVSDRFLVEDARGTNALCNSE